MNGRVNILGHNPADRFLLYEKPKDYKATPYTNALIGNFQATLLSKAFFSADNVEILQNAIVAGVFEKSNKRFRIGYQDEDTLKTIMRAMYLQYSKNLDMQDIGIFWQLTIKTIEDLKIISNENLFLEMYVMQLIHLKDINQKNNFTESEGSENKITIFSFISC